MRWFATTCSTGKRGYATKAEARKVARRRRKEGDERLMAPYVCQECSHIHLGHLPKVIKQGEITRREYYDGEVA